MGVLFVLAVRICVVSGVMGVGVVLETWRIRFSTPHGACALFSYLSALLVSAKGPLLRLSPACLAVNWRALQTGLEVMRFPFIYFWFLLILVYPLLFLSLTFFFFLVLYRLFLSPKPLRAAFAVSHSQYLSATVH